MEDHIMEGLTPYIRKADHYEVLERRFPSTVSLVREKESGKKIVKKTVHFENDENSDKYFIREINLLYEFRIDGLPFLKLNGFNFPIDEEEAFIATEYVDGVPLIRLIRYKFNKCSDISTTKMIIIYGIAFALKLIHSKSLYHGHLNPHNIVINKQNEPFLTDFGNLYNISPEPNHFPCFSENDAYVAPELLFSPYDDDKTDPSPSSDVYSFAIILFQILGGYFCFNGQSIKNSSFIPHVLKGQRFDMPNSDVIPNGFRKMITQCWSQQPLERGTMEDIVKSLDSGNLVLKGCNMDVYNNYIQKLKTINDHKEKKT